nr:MAG TPA_asm: hypothetical protein [Caudoviricetes sp.]
MKIIRGHFKESREACAHPTNIKYSNPIVRQGRLNVA